MADLVMSALGERGRQRELALEESCITNKIIVFIGIAEMRTFITQHCDAEVRHE